MKERRSMQDGHGGRRTLRWMLLALLAGLCGCGKVAAPPPVATAPAGGGVVVSVRQPVAGGETRGSILGAVGAAPAPAQDGMAEIIVRDDAGQAVSVMQANAQGLRPGDRVVLTGGARTRVARPGL